MATEIRNLRPLDALRQRAAEGGLAAQFLADEIEGARKGAALGHLRFGRFYTQHEADGLMKAFALPPEAFAAVQVPLRDAEMQRGEPWPLPHTSPDDRARIRPVENARGPSGCVVVQMLNTRWWMNLAGSPCHPQDERARQYADLHA